MAPDELAEVGVSLLLDAAVTRPEEERTSCGDIDKLTEPDEAGDGLLRNEGEDMPPDNNCGDRPVRPLEEREERGELPRSEA